jgi:DNA polymerase III alpha subunit
MKTNTLHQVIVGEEDMIEVLYRGTEINGLVVDQSNWLEQFNYNCHEYGLKGIMDWVEESDLDPESFITQNLTDWHMPKEYQELDLANYLLSKCKTDTQRMRVQQELVEFEKRDMMIVLCWMKYFVDTLRQNKLVWGVGRGSSVASYVLFLLDVHRVDSLEYELDIKEFLK